jgi:hypothetical protein
MPALAGIDRAWLTTIHGEDRYFGLTALSGGSRRERSRAIHTKGLGRKKLVFAEKRRYTRSFDRM